MTHNITHSKRLQIIALNMVGICFIYAISFCYGRHAQTWAGKDTIQFSEVIVQASRLYDLNPALIAAVIQTESNFKPNAVSYAGAKGLMQINPPTQRYLKLRDAYDPQQNIFAGSRYLRELLNRFNGDIVSALAAYNAGPGAVDRHDGVPPYKETRKYVQKVLSYYTHYRKLLTSDPLMS